MLRRNRSRSSTLREKSERGVGGRGIGLWAMAICPTLTARFAFRVGTQAT
jgi:hypothetical protein